MRGPTSSTSSIVHQEAVAVESTQPHEAQPHAPVARQRPSGMRVTRTRLYVGRALPRLRGSNLNSPAGASAGTQSLGLPPRSRTKASIPERGVAPDESVISPMPPHATPSGPSSSRVRKITAPVITTVTSGARTSARRLGVALRLSRRCTKRPYGRPRPECRSASPPAEEPRLASHLRQACCDGSVAG